MGNRWVANTFELMEHLLTHKAHSPDDLQTVARVLLKELEHPVWALSGEMGVGKTAFVRAVCDELGVADTVSSPTFGLIQEYLGSNSELVYHFDFYRIQLDREAVDMGAEMYFYSGQRCLIEWPEKVENLLPDPHHLIEIRADLSGVRTFEVKR
jgi:tRNA threonylcarbamoyladenosine biosynthesis protein TsaE